MQDYDAVMSLNLRGVFLCLKHQIPFMMATSDAPAIVIMGSGAGHIGGELTSPYTMSKWALRGLAACAAREYGPLGLR
jgi:NAD(P)-dependent dehydrogenase (short-subunit alcohol dehydrogenase family)